MTVYRLSKFSKFRPERVAVWVERLEKIERIVREEMEAHAAELGIPEPTIENVVEVERNGAAEGKKDGPAEPEKKPEPEPERKIEEKTEPKPEQKPAVKQQSQPKIRLICKPPAATEKKTSTANDDDPLPAAITPAPKIGEIQEKESEIDVKANTVQGIKHKIVVNKVTTEYDGQASFTSHTENSKSNAENNVKKSNTASIADRPKDEMSLTIRPKKDDKIVANKPPTDDKKSRGPLIVPVFSTARALIEIGSSNAPLTAEVSATLEHLPIGDNLALEDAIMFDATDGEWEAIMKDAMDADFDDNSDGLTESEDHEMIDCCE